MKWKLITGSVSEAPISKSLNSFFLVFISWELGAVYFEHIHPLPQLLPPPVPLPYSGGLNEKCPK